MISLARATARAVWVKYARGWAAWAASLLTIRAGMGCLGFFSADWSDDWCGAGLHSLMAAMLLDAPRRRREMGRQIENYCTNALSGLPRGPEFRGGSSQLAIPHENAAQLCGEVTPWVPARKALLGVICSISPVALFTRFGFCDKSGLLTLSRSLRSS